MFHTHFPARGRKPVVPAIDRKCDTTVCFIPISPQGDGNGQDELYTLLPAQVWFHTHFPARGRKLFTKSKVQCLSLQIVSYPFPRKGTETENKLTSPLKIFLCFIPISPQGDGNEMQKALMKAFESVCFIPISPQGDGNLSRHSCFHLNPMQPFHTHFPARGRKLVFQMIRIDLHFRISFIPISPQGDGNFLSPHHRFVSNHQRFIPISPQGDGNLETLRHAGDFTPTFHTHFPARGRKP